MAVVVLLLCVFNVVMWLVQIVRFKNIFSTDDIMKETREQLNNMLMDINRNAERNINLINDRIEELKKVTEEADRHIQLLKGEVALVEKSNAFQSQYERIVHPEPPAPQLPVKEMETRVKDAKPKTPAKPKKPKVSKSRNPVTAYRQEQEQGDLFVSDKSSEERISLVVENSENNAQPQVQSDIPVITKAKEPIVIKKSFNREVQELAAQGMKVEEIASKLGRTIPEVNFALEIS
ncbi:MAG: hypothetical protein J6W60_10135 [Treponema sp.]|nr:hypothetical protein [Treponema sp.]MBP5753196.1 hypothetical protein [Treponema sp.]MBR4005621.1 hypothetical protein [Treponema sp.]